jgi:DNA (cytosine-5)-methyltransferase 1
VEGGVMPTLNAFDNGDIRTTVAVLMRMREGKPGGGKGPLLSEDKSLTIATVNDQTLFHKSDVRRLTPVECERLQGFPDDWTAGQSDSARYKQMGNAVAVPVVEWIIQGIVDTLI